MGELIVGCAIELVAVQGCAIAMPVERAVLFCKSAEEPVEKEEADAEVPIHATITI